MIELRISPAELRQRRERALSEVKAQGAGGFVLFNATSIFYLTGFAFIPTERPAALVLGGDGGATLFVPRLEQEHAGEQAEVDAVRSYPEYPGEKHPMLHLAEILDGTGGTIAADAPGYGSAWGYDGPKLEDVLPGAKVIPFPKLIERHRVIKSPAEIALIRESARWGNLAHTLLQEYSLPGRTETEISSRASLEATATMIKTLGPSFEPRGTRGAGASAGFRARSARIRLSPTPLRRTCV